MTFKNYSPLVLDDKKDSDSSNINQLSSEWTERSSRVSDRECHGHAATHNHTCGDNRSSSDYPLLDRTRTDSKTWKTESKEIDDKSADDYDRGPKRPRLNSVENNPVKGTEHQTFSTNKANSCIKGAECLGRNQSVEGNSSRAAGSVPLTGGGVVFLSKKQRESLKKKEEGEKRLIEKGRKEELHRKRKELDKYRSFPESGSFRRLDSRYREDHREARRENYRNETPRKDERTYKDREPEQVTTNESNTDTTEGARQQLGADIQKAWNDNTNSNLAKLQLFNLEDLEVKQERRDLEQIREHYLGLRKEKKKMQKPSEKFRNIFNFEWNVNEDTAKGDNNDLYLLRVEPQLLFGRGFRAGIDVREQRRHNNFYDELIKRRSDVAGEDLPAIDKTKQALIRSRDIEQGDKNRRHWTEKARDEMTDRDWRIFREDFEIYIKGGRVPPPARKWDECGLPDELLKAVHSCGYEKPTPIQMQAIPIALEQRDLIGIAETGSGKTAAFVLPMLTYVKSLPPLNDETSQDGPYALVLAPSRELALQIDDETQKFASFCKCRTVAVVGGRSAEVQAFELRRGAEIVIGTPGRIKDCLERSYTVLSQCNYVVLDEADRMIDLGFEEIVNWILDQIPSSNLKSEDESQAYQQELEAKAGYRRYRLTQMFSATMPPAVERLSRKYLKAPAFISIGDPGAGKRAIEQRLEFMLEGKKRQRLEHILQDAEPPVMVFVNQKKVADVIAKTLQKMGFNAASLHGGKAQDMREQSLNDFKQGSVDILVATDVAGRGIDVEGVQLVVNFDMPKEIANYTHRIGRTGRAGKKGLAISFITEDDSGILYDLKQLLISTNNVVPHELANHPAAKIKPGTAPPATISASGQLQQSQLPSGRLQKNPTAS